VENENDGVNDAVDETAGLELTAENDSEGDNSGTLEVNEEAMRALQVELLETKAKLHEQEVGNSKLGYQNHRLKEEAKTRQEAGQQNLANAGIAYNSGLSEVLIGKENMTEEQIEMAKAKLRHNYQNASDNLDYQKYVVRMAGSVDKVLERAGITDENADATKLQRDFQEAANKGIALEEFTEKAVDIATAHLTKKPDVETKAKTTTEQDAEAAKEARKQSPAFKVETSKPTGGGKAQKLTLKQLADMPVQQYIKLKKEGKLDLG